MATNLTRHSVWTQLSKSQGRLDTSEQSDHIKVFYPSLCLGVIFRPYSFEFVQVVRPQNRPVPRQIVKIVHDDSHEEVDDQERTEHVKADEVDNGKVAPTSIFLSWVVI